MFIAGLPEKLCCLKGDGLTTIQRYRSSTGEIYVIKSFEENDIPAQDAILPLIRKDIIKESGAFSVFINDRLTGVFIPPKDQEQYQIKLNPMTGAICPDGYATFKFTRGNRDTSPYIWIKDPRTMTYQPFGMPYHWAFTFLEAMRTSMCDPNDKTYANMPTLCLSQPNDTKWVFEQNKNGGKYHIFLPGIAGHDTIISQIMTHKSIPKAIIKDSTYDIYCVVSYYQSNNQIRTKQVYFFEQKESPKYVQICSDPESTLYGTPIFDSATKIVELDFSDKITMTVHLNSGQEHIELDNNCKVSDSWHTANLTRGDITLPLSLDIKRVKDAFI